MPRIIPEARYPSMPSSVVGGLALRKDARNCWPWVRSFTQAPLIWTNSPALIIAAWPTTVIRSRWPLALIRSTQNPFSGLWNVTRSTKPAKASVAAVWPKFATSWPFARIEFAVVFLPAIGRSGRHWLSTGGQRHLEAGNRAQPGQGADQGAGREDRLQRLHRGRGHGGRRDGRSAAGTLRAVDGGDRSPRAELRPGRGADRRQAAASDRCLRHGDRALLRLQGVGLTGHLGAELRVLRLRRRHGIGQLSIQRHRPRHGDRAYGISNGATSVAWRWSARCIEKLSARHGGSHLRSARSDASGT